MNTSAPIDQNPTDLSRFSFWQGVKLALKGTEADYTTISLKRAILLLAVPMILELVMESTFAVVDIYFVGRLGSSAVATVGLTESYLFLIYSIAMGVSMAVTAIVARRIGEKNSEQAGITAVQSILLATLCAVPFMVAGLFYSRDLMSLMGADAWTLEHGLGYTRWMLVGNVVIMLLFVINAIFRGAGDAALAMRILIISNGVNLLLDPLLIFGLGPVPAMGVEGAAIATNTGRGIGVLVQFYYLFRGGKHIRLLPSHWRWHGESMVALIRTSLGGVAQMFVSISSWMFLMRILADVGSAAVAGATITVRLLMFTLMPAWGLSNAAATLVGQNLGAGKPGRAEKSVWVTGIYNMGVLLIISVIFFTMSRPLIGIFSTDAQVIEIGAEWLRILSYSYFVYGWWMVSVQAFNGAGDTRTPTLINIVFFWLIQIPLCYLLALRLGWQQSGVFWGVFITETSTGLFTLWLFTRGRWKTVKV